MGRNLRLRRCEQDYSAHLGKLQGCLHIEGGENGFHGDCVRGKLLDKAGNQEMNFSQTHREGDAGRKFKRAVTHERRSAIPYFNDAVTRGTRDSGIHTQHAELWSL